MRHIPAHVLSALLLASCGGRSEGSSPTPSPAPVTAATKNADLAEKPLISETRINEIVTEVMKEQYGGQGDVAMGCWNYRFEENGIETTYCMKPGAPEVVETTAGRNVYVPVSNTIESNSTESYGAVTPGLMGAFLLQVRNDGKWSYLARERGLAFGTMGYCGCDKAKFMRLGRDYYGWMFTSGGTWQGVTVSNHEIVAPRSGGFKDISDIPEVREAAPDVMYSVEIAPATVASIYALKVTKLVAEKPTSAKLVEFDPVTWAYQMPEKF